jgi:hypothetical protein
MDMGMDMVMVMEMGIWKIINFYDG